MGNKPLKSSKGGLKRTEHRTTSPSTTSEKEADKRVSLPILPSDSPADPTPGSVWRAEELAALRRAFRLATGSEEEPLDLRSFSVFLDNLPELGLRNFADTPVAVGLWRILVEGFKSDPPPLQPTSSHSSPIPSSSTSDISTPTEISTPTPTEISTIHGSEISTITLPEATTSSPHPSIPPSSPRVSLDEMLAGLPQVLKSPYQERLALTLLVYDTNRDGLVSRQEMTDMYRGTYSALIGRLRRQATPPQAVHLPKSQQFQDEMVASLAVRFNAQLDRILDQLFLALDADGDQMLTEAEFFTFLKTVPIVSAQYELHYNKDGLPAPKHAAEFHKIVSGNAPLSLLSAISIFQ